MIPVSVIVTTKNEALNLPHSLPQLVRHCDEVIVVDSSHDDETRQIVRQCGAGYIGFTWNGKYPKKRQWCLDHLPLKHDYVLFIDADEIADDAFFDELSTLSWDCDGYFISSRMVWRGTLLNHGMRNNKLCLFRRGKFAFPVIDDLNMTGMGEIEGHYQPVPHDGMRAVIGQIKTPLVHHDRRDSWNFRHHNYAMWEAAMNKRGAWPVDPVPYREFLKRFLRRYALLRPAIIFVYAYILKRGFLDGRAGLDYALARAKYARLIGLCMKMKGEINNQIDDKQAAGQH